MSKDLELFKSELSLELFYMHICMHNANTEDDHKVTQGNKNIGVTSSKTYYR